MSKHSLTTSRKTVIEPGSPDKIYRLSAGLFASSAAVVYIAIGQGNDADIILSSSGTTHTMLQVPPRSAVEAWTDTGTAELAVMKEEMA